MKQYESTKTQTRLTLARIVFPLLLACLVGSSALGADPAPVPTLQVTDLFRPPVDPDDHWDLASQYALAWQGKVDLRGVMIDRGWRPGPDIIAVAQMNYITGKAVPVVIGSPRMPTAEELRTGVAAGELAGVRAFLELMRQAPRPVVIHVVGSCRDVALAARLEPELFARRCAAIYLNAGVGTPDPEKQRKLECNVNYDPASYAAMFEVPCPVYWLPCDNSIYSFQQSDILPHLADRVQNYFMSIYTGGQSAGGLWLQQLAGPTNTEALAAQGKRNMWCTAGFLHAAGLTVTKAGEIVPLNSTNEPVFTFEPICVKCSATGVTEWTKDPQSKNRFIFRATDVQQYRSAMTFALKALLLKLP